MMEEEPTLRPATDADVPALARLWAQAFPGERSAEDRMSDLRGGGTYGGVEDAWVAEADGRIAGALRTYRLTAHLWGRRYPTMGLAAVAVAPDFRRRGIGRRMCVEALRIGRGRGEALSLLYPFRVSYYRALGYTLVGEMERHRFAPRSLRPLPGAERVVWASQREETEVRDVYARVAGASNGMIERPTAAWRFLRDPARSLFVYRDEAGEARGYLAVRSRKGRAGTRVVVRELVAERREAYEGLVGWMARQGDQWGEVVYDALPSEAFHRRLEHPRRPGTGGRRGLWFESAGILRGPMLRVLDVPRILADAAVPEVTNLRIRDEQLPENDGVWEGGPQPRRAAREETGAQTLDIGELSDRFARGALGSGPPHPTGWVPALGIPDFRLLDEF